jgi:hypothetical protein
MNACSSEGLLFQKLTDDNRASQSTSSTLTFPCTSLPRREIWDHVLLPALSFHAISVLLLRWDLLVQICVYEQIRVYEQTTCLVVNMGGTIL